MYETRVLDPGELDLDEYTALQRGAFDEVYGAAGVAADFLRPAHYAWKYNPPAGRGRIAVATESGGNPVAAVAMYPLRFATHSGVTTAWQLCDGGTLRGARGKGQFSACVAALVETLESGDLLFGFPNPSSKPALARFGLREVQRVPTFVRLTALGGSAAARPTDDDRDDDCQPVSTADAPSIVRDAAYIAWRYRTNPSARYAILCETDGYAVVRRAAVGRRNVGLLMEFHAASRGTERRLFRRASEWGAHHGVRYLVTASSCFSAWAAIRNRLVRVPRRLTPRPLVLMALPRVAMPAGDWRIQFGDWDAF